MRRRVLAITIATTTLVVVAFVLPLAGLIRSVARDRAISAAEHDSAALAPSLADPFDDSRVVAAIDRTATGADGRLTVWVPDQPQLGDQTPPDETAVALARERQEAFSQKVDGGLVLYAPVVTGADRTSVVRARVPRELLEQGVARAWVALAGVGVTLVALAVLIADRLARSLNREATALAATARVLAGGDPQARVSPGATPELADAARALNLLADRIDELREAERARVADLSHRLRTPLTALRLDAEAAGDDELTADVDRLEAAVTELIHAAQRPLHEGVLRPHCDLAAVVRDRAEFWGVLADDDGRSWQLDLGAATGEPGGRPRPVPAALSAGEAAAAVDALIGNVFGHTPDGTAYRLSLVLDGPTVPSDHALADHGTADDAAGGRPQRAGSPVTDDQPNATSTDHPRQTDTVDKAAAGRPDRASGPGTADDGTGDDGTGDDGTGDDAVGGRYERAGSPGRDERSNAAGTGDSRRTGGGGEGPGRGGAGIPLPRHGGRGRGSRDAVVGQVAVLHVDDAGPGIRDPEAVLARGHSSVRSTGLGLDIARRAAEAAGGALAIGKSPLGGTRVTLTFPAPPP